MKDIVILGGARTPIGSFQGTLSSTRRAEAGLDRHQVRAGELRRPADQIEQVIMGNVLQAGVGQAPARQAGIGAGIPVSAGAVTVNKVCGSGLKAVMYAANDIRCDEYDLADRRRHGVDVERAVRAAAGAHRLSHGQRQDDRPHDPRRPVGSVRRQAHGQLRRELCVAKYKFTREEQDDFSRESYRRAQDAVQGPASSRKRSPSSRCQGRRATSVVVDDEEPFAAPLDKMGSLKPAFQKDGGTVTAANASKINDGAAALVVTSADTRRRTAEADGAHRRAGHRGAGAGVVHDCAGEGDRHRPAARRA